jgi:hypothetical protein
MIKTSSRLLFLLLITLMVYACKKDKGSDSASAPVAAYNFDGDVKNSVSDQLHGILVGPSFPSTDSFNVSGSSYLFKGDTYVKVKDAELLDFTGNQFTVAAWIRPFVISGTYIVHKARNSGGGSAYSLDIYPGTVRATMRSTTDEFFEVTSSTKVVKNVWQHVAATFNGQQLTVYYNGKAESSKEINKQLTITTGDLAIGAYAFAFPDANFEGKLDNIRLYDKALTADQIMHLYQNYKQ